MTSSFVATAVTRATGRRFRVVDDLIIIDLNIFATFVIFIVIEPVLLLLLIFFVVVVVHLTRVVPVITETKAAAIREVTVVVTVVQKRHWPD